MSTDLRPDIGTEQADLPAFDPDRTFRVALQAPPQETPTNLHGILTGPSLSTMREIAVGLRMAAGPVLVLAGDDAAAGAPPGSPIRELDFTGCSFRHPFQLAAFRALCEHAAGDGVDVVKRAWYHVAHQDAVPGSYRLVHLHPGPRAISIAELESWFERHQLPYPIDRSTHHEVLVRSLGELRSIALQGWQSQNDRIRVASRNSERITDIEDGLGQTFASAPEVAVASHRVSLEEAVAQEDRIRGAAIAALIRDALRGSTHWQPFASPVQVITAGGGDEDRVALVLECCLIEAQARMRCGDGAVRTIIIDRSLLRGAAEEVGESIARTGRKFNCTALILSPDLNVPKWSEVAGFTVREHRQRTWLSTDQEYEVAIEHVLDPESLAHAHALLSHQGRQGMVKRAVLALLAMLVAIGGSSCGTRLSDDMFRHDAFDDGDRAEIDADRTRRAIGGTERLVSQPQFVYLDGALVDTNRMRWYWLADGMKAPAVDALSVQHSPAHVQTMHPADTSGPSTVVPSSQRSPVDLPPLPPPSVLVSPSVSAPPTIAPPDHGTPAP